MTPARVARWLATHDRTLILAGVGAAILIAVIGLLARSRPIDWQRLIGDFLPGWPWR